MVSDTTEDQRNLFQSVLFFSLISHIELNEQHMMEKSTLAFGINHQDVLTDPQIPKFYLITGRNGRRWWHMEADVQLLFQPVLPNLPNNPQRQILVEERTA